MDDELFACLFVGIRSAIHVAIYIDIYVRKESKEGREIESKIDIYSDRDYKNKYRLCAHIWKKL